MADRPDRFADIVCGDAPVVLPPRPCAGVDITRQRRRSGACDPAPECPPARFVKPDAKPVDKVTQFSIPAPFAVANDEVTASCPDSQSGSHSVVLSGEVVDYVYWTDVVDITPDQLHYISQSPDYGLIAGLDPSTITAVTGLRPYQTADFLSRVAAVKESVNDAALIAATQALDCWWENVDQVATCPAGSVSDAEYPEVGRAVPTMLVPAGSHKSYTSQEDADTQAMTAAEAGLVCCFGNVAITVTCDSIGIPVSDANRPSDMPTSAVVAANTRFSCVSQESANAEAMALAVSMLNCAFRSAAISIECPDTTPRIREIGGVNEGNRTSIAAILDDKGLADYTTGTPGSRVELPAGYVTSTESQAAADAEAMVIAQALLSCNWINDSATLACPKSLYNGVWYSADPAKSGGGYVAADRGIFVSPYGADAVLDQLESHLLLTLVCVYCNSAVAPLCEHGSLDATPGYPAGQVCANSKEAAQAIAVGLGNIKITPGASDGNCTYGNDEITKTCADKVASIAGLDARSVASVTIQANTYTLKHTDPVEGKRLANAMASSAALSALVCLFSNPPGTFYCGTGANSPTHTEYVFSIVGAYYTGGGDEQGWMSELGALASGSHQVAAASSGSPGNPVTVPADMFTSYVGASEVNAQVRAFVMSALNCFYENVRVEVLCGALRENIVSVAKGTATDIRMGTNTLSDGTPVHAGSSGSVVNPVIVPPAMTTSRWSHGDANYKAIEMAFNSLSCYIENAEERWDCGRAGKTLPGLTPESNGPDNPLIFPAGYARSYISLQDLTNQMEVAGKASVQCVYRNRPVSVSCPEGTEPRNIVPSGGGLPEQFVYSTIDEDDATRIAMALSAGMLQCFSPDELGGSDGADGSPGNDGAQKECKGNCFGFYS